MLKALLATYTLNKPTFRMWGKRIMLVLCIVFVIWYINCLPDQLFSDGTSTVLLDKNGELMGARIANDGQWRFKHEERLPPRFATCLLEFEDKEFYRHPGISIRGICRAIVQNVKNQRVVSGGSTITMQVARLMRKNPPRTVREKILEMILATRIEIRYSKKEILDLYAANAPFGNNVVGLEAASWRYFGRKPESLSWAECATLAVLPNAPGLIYPGKNHQRLLEKRNRLLLRLRDSGKIDSTVCELALIEPLPDKPMPLPQLASHLLNRFIKKGLSGQTIKSTVDINIQTRAIQLLEQHHAVLKENKIFNGALIITSVKSGKVVAYVGNIRSEDPEHGADVDCISAPRSTGSILKPLLYAKSLEDGLITPGMLLPDVPTHFGSFAPKNFAQQYDGAVAANKALSRSLNIPMVRLLNDYGLEKFHSDLKHYGLTTLNKPAKYYGLSLILGGAEARLDELSGAYTHMAQELQYGKHKPICFSENKSQEIKRKQRRNKHKTLTQTNPACIYSTFEAMVDVNRPDEDGNWKVFSSSQKIAWKTGTSFGFRDAWAIGITPDYVVAVWVGNADGEGRPGLTGVKAAAPLLFNVFAQLPKSTTWFQYPHAYYSKTLICAESGCRASSVCVKKDTVSIPNSCLNTLACPFHQMIHLTKNGKYRVDSECESVYNMKHVPWFVLPPIIEKYYRYNHPGYKTLPEYKPECKQKIADKAMALLYPKPNSRIYVPVEIDGSIGRTVFEATHRNPDTKLYWHLDDCYVGETRDIHQVALNPSVGVHKLTLVDENGISLTVSFETLGRSN